MEDYKILWYILAAIIYFITRKKKKKGAETSRPGTENNPTPQSPTKSFEDLLREISGERVDEPEEEVYTETEVIEEQKDVSWDEAEKEQRLEGERRAFADDESRRVYEESIKRAEGFNLEFDKAEQYQETKIFKEDSTEEDEYTFADEIRDGLSSSEARKAIIYSEILTRKY